MPILIILKIRFGYLVGIIVTAINTVIFIADVLMHRNRKTLWESHTRFDNVTFSVLKTYLAMLWVDEIEVPSWIFLVAIIVYTGILVLLLILFMTYGLVRTTVSEEGKRDDACKYL